MKCYLCKVSDPNRTHFNPKVHQICLTCSVKLWELARKGIKFDMRKQAVVITTKDQRKKVSKNRTVTLTTGREVNLADTEGLEHLFNTIIGEVTARLKGTKEFSEKGFGIVYDVCICELHFIAGQLQHMGSRMDIEMLLDEFGVQWDRLADKFNRGNPDS